MATARKAPAKTRGRPAAKPRAAKPIPDDYDDLIGGPEPTGLNEQEIEELNQGLDLAVVLGGVSASWLGMVFKMDKNTVKKKLGEGKCEVVGQIKGAPQYRIKDAAAFLVPPKVDIGAYVKGLRPQDLPPILNDAYWAAQLKRQKWEENAGDLWRTADVLEVLADMGKLVKSTVQLWTDQLPNLNDAQREQMTQMSDNLLHEIYNVMVEAPKLRATQSSAAEPEAEPDDGI